MRFAAREGFDGRRVQPVNVRDIYPIYRLVNILKTIMGRANVSASLVVFFHPPRSAVLDKFGRRRRPPSRRTWDKGVDARRVRQG